MPRPPEYHRESVIARALEVFREQGYGGTSVSDLVAATGLQPGSLYAAFGNKKGVFLEVLDQYNLGFLERLEALIADDEPAIDNIRKLLDGIVEEKMSGVAEPGCLTVNALLELSRHDDEVTARLHRYNDRIRRALTRLLEAARTEGDVPADRDPTQLSAFLMNNIWGMRVMCRNRPSRADLESVVAGVMAAISAD